MTTPPTAADIRTRFIDFFRSRGGNPTAGPDQHGHAFVPSSPVVPHDDPTLLFTNAGMNQFKPIFLGQVDPASSFATLRRAVNTQKCIRAGGKHNDLDDVGKDTYHHTFFEMLGTWSFGDYFKADTIAWAFEFLTEACGIPADRLYATYFGGDDDQPADLEAKQLWLRHLPESRILPGSAKDNFWEMGDTGPCGPCSEIHFDRIGGRDASHLVNQDDPDVLEVWNLVFIQFDRQEGGALKPLPAKHVDTGMGLERLVSVLQNKRSNYDTDLFTPLFVAIKEATGFAKPYGGKVGKDDADRVDMAYRVVADHVRTLSFAIADGAVPSNDGRGYVLRRVLRRAVRFGRQMLGAEGPFVHKIVPTLAEHMGEMFPELRKHKKQIVEVIHEEEESFLRTLDKGMAHFNEIAEGTRTIAGADAFKLYDTYGFPLDLTQLMAEERGIGVDTAGFEAEMAAQKERSRAGAKSGEKRLALTTEAVAKLQQLGIAPTVDAPKHANKPIASVVKAIWNGTDFDQQVHTGRSNRIGLVLNDTCFYAEAGGQVADVGRIVHISGPRSSGRSGPEGEMIVEDVIATGGYVLHVGRLTRGELRVGDHVELRLDRTRRDRIAANHTATHLLNLALREHVGAHVDQKGSLVEDERLRFDFSNAGPVEDEKLAAIEAMVREQIEADLSVHAESAPLEMAQRINTLRAVFGERYPDPVRVVSIGVPIDQLMSHPLDPANMRRSVEFCGGTHLASTGAAGAFALVSETGVAKGIRRIEALTGVPAMAAIAAADQLAAELARTAKMDDAELAESLPALSAELDALTLPIGRRTELRAKLNGLQERAKRAAKDLARKRAQIASEQAKAIAQDAKASGQRVIVSLLDLGEDRGAIQQAVKVISDACPESAVLVVSTDHEAGKVALLAQVPDAMIKAGLKAGDWIRETAAVVGGKGGGKPNSAQGGGTEPAKADEAVRIAQAFADKTLG